MLNGNKRCFTIKGLNSWERDLIYAYLQGAVYRRCNENPNDWFAARDLVGGKNYYWQGTPLIVVYERFRKANPPKSSEYAEDMAAKAIGHMLKRVIVDDKRTFDTQVKNLVRHYKWTGAENNSITPKWQRAAAAWYKRLRDKAEKYEQSISK